MRRSLPVAEKAQVWRYLRATLGGHSWALTGVLMLHCLAATAGLVAPRLIGRLVGAIERGVGGAVIDKLALALLVFVTAQSILVRLAYLASSRLGEQILAELRESFVDRILAVPLPVVERAGTGDLLTRLSRDVAAVSQAIRFALPDTLIASITVVLGVGALLLLSPLLLLPVLIAVPTVWVSTKWYLLRAPAGYLRESAAHADVTNSLAETVNGARTVEALRLEQARRERSDADIRQSYAADRYTLFIRTVWWPILEISYVLPAAASLIVGGWFYFEGWVTLGQVVAATLYVRQLTEPLQRLLYWLDGLQVGATSLARLIGISQTSAGGLASAISLSIRGQEVSEEAEIRSPLESGGRLCADNIHYSYDCGRDVVRGISLDVTAGERLAIVGPSGAGKSTLARLLAGLCQPDRGTVTIDGTRLSELSLDELRRQVALVTQEHHTFLGTLRENLVLSRPLAADEEVESALDAIGALQWVRDLPHGVETMLGAGNRILSAGQAQQLALARLLIADPRVVVLDEATSLIAPYAARHLEGALSAILQGRAVIVIAHRLFSAQDADRVAVVEEGRIREVGSHQELVAAGGLYAKLWRSWHA